MSSTPEKLVRMANQIASFFATQPGDKAVAATAQHLRDFWDPSMIEGLGALLKTGNPGLDPVALRAAEEVLGLNKA